MAEANVAEEVNREVKSWALFAAKEEAKAEDA
jgi:hypothetical protein